MGSTQSTWGHRERGMSAPNSPGGGARNRKKFQTAAQLDEAFDNFKAGQKDEDTEKSGKQKMKGFMKDVCRSRLVDTRARYLWCVSGLHLWPNGDAVPFRCNCSAAHNLAEPEHVRR